MGFFPPFPNPRKYPDYTEYFQHLNARVNGIYDRLGIITTKLGHIMTAQDDVAAAVAALQNEESGVAAVAADLQAAVTNIQAELSALQGQGVDTSALNDAVAALGQPLSDLQASQASVDALETPAA